ncbi:hypothetical protein ACH44C_22300 [Streptomyces purpureus]|uniref:hypothetical protein n=1 Tax=Streptomyces purpureus TaxID=1951 RepID=UPI00379A3437
MRFALRTAIATAVVAGVALTPMATAATAFAAEKPVQQNGPAVTDKTAVGSGATTGETTTGETKPADGRNFVKQVDLGHGLSAKVYLVDGPDYLAEIIEDGAVIFSLRGGEGKAHKGLWVTMNSDGDVSAKPQPGGFVLHKEQDLLEGMRAKVFKDRGTGELRADIHKGQRKLFSLKVGQVKTYNNVEIRLLADARVIARQLHGGMGALVGTEHMTNGTVLKVYENGTAGYRAIAFVKGASIGTVDANGGHGAAVYGGEYFLLTPAGKTHVWAVNSVGGKAGIYALPNGKDVRLAKDAAGRWGVNDGHRKTHSVANPLLKGNGRHQVLDFGGGALVIVSPDGTKFGNYVTTAAKQAPAVFLGIEDAGAPAKSTSTKTTQVAAQGTTSTTAVQTSVVPRGAVAAGAELTESGDSTALVATGAGAASLAAAGLGFVALRRRAADARG